VDASLPAVWNVLNQSGRFCEYMPRYLRSDLVDPAALPDALSRDHWSRPELEALVEQNRLADWPGDTVLFYNVLDMPFPVSDRWYLLRMWREPEQYAIRWTMVAGNMNRCDGGWSLAESGTQGRTLAAYETLSDPGIQLPGFILDMGLTQTLPGVIEALRKRVRSAATREQE
jgi:hypothetical protein